MLTTHGRRHRLALAIAAGVGLAGLSLVGAGTASAAAPGNDDVGGATTLAPNTLVVGSTDEATIATGENRCTSDTPVRTVWYAYTPAVSETVSFQTTGVGDYADTFLTVFSGPANATAFDDLTYLGCNDDGASLFSYLEVDVTAGTTYYVQADTFSEDVPPGSFAIRVNTPVAPGPKPANDDLVSAARLITARDVLVDNRAATTEASEPEQAACPGSIHNSVWFWYRPAIDRSFYPETLGAYGSVINVWTGPPGATTPAQLTAEICDSSAGGDAGMEVAGVAGTTYYIQVGSTDVGGHQPFVFGADTDWAQPSKVTGSIAVGAQSLTLSATAVPNVYADVTDPDPFSGSVELVENDVTIGSAAVSGTTATVTVPRPTAGTHNYLVLFTSGTSYYQNSWRTLTVTVPKVAAQLTVKAPKKVKVKAKPGKHGKPVVKAKKVKLRASVVTSSAPATGQVTFKVGKKTVQGTLVNGVATVKVKLRATASVTVTYAGDANTEAATATTKIKVKVKKPRR
jgi:hypothetical protein